MREHLDQPLLEGVGIGPETARGTGGNDPSFGDHADFTTQVAGFLRVVTALSLMEESSAYLFSESECSVSHAIAPCRFCTVSAAR